MAIFSQCKTVEEKEFYLKLAKQENYSFRELDRQISASLFERKMIGNTKLSTALRETNQDLTNTFKDSYVFEFLSLPKPHYESDLQRGLVRQMKNFILELGKDFLFIREEYKLQVGNSNFYIDLLFFHRGLQCLVAFELKADKFKPDHLGQLNFHASQPADIQEMLEHLRLAIKQAAPMAIETISCGMPAFRQNKILVYYALNKEHIGFYPTPNPIAYFKKELEKYNTSKGAIQFPIDKPLPLTLIKKIVKFRLDEDAQSLNKNVLSGVLHELPDDIEKVLKADTDILARWNNLTPIQRNEWICWVTIVKKTKTRAEHIHRMIEELKEGKRKPCCWPGCPHRKPSAQKWFK